MKTQACQVDLLCQLHQRLGQKEGLLLSQVPLALWATAVTHEIAQLQRIHCLPPRKATMVVGYTRQLEFLAVAPWKHLTCADGLPLQ